MALREPMSNAPFNLAKKIETAVVRQVTEITYQVRNSMRLDSAALLLKNGDCISAGGYVIGLIHRFSNLTISWTLGAGYQVGNLHNHRAIGADQRSVLLRPHLQTNDESGESDLLIWR